MINACVFSNGKSLRRSTTSGLWRTTTLDAAGLGKLQNVRRNNMIYDYCNDTRRFPHDLPPDGTLIVCTADVYLYESMLALG
ncbi:hypothetical protein ZOSMA_33G00900 [Zostera marina]|uniref:Xyloglucan endo-transglycosylase C-terminal domain-containing protein n=1 Tax=Zostera marina TaxID=29655 RepID=A0A0K9P7R6_ZOSMR|nr:hypothetical protein ZOSMA_33G00900 [Zostera marina]